LWDERDLVQLIGDHLRRHPAVEVRDVYKLLYQGVLGPEHLIASPEEFAAWLRAEYAALAPETSEPLWESIRPDGRLGRLNLRPFKAAAGDLDWLIAACLRTAEQTWGTLEELRAVWAGFVGLCRARQWEQLPAAEAAAFSAWLEEHGWPAAHHSEGYRQANRPAYRLLAHQALTSLPTGTGGGEER
jgi:hypothetical protein